MSSSIQPYLHCMWATDSRRPLITPEIEQYLYTMIATKCRALGCMVIAIGGCSDHIHLLVQSCPGLSTSGLIDHIKSSSIQAVNYGLGFLPSQSFKWQDGYRAFTISNRSLDQVKKYVLHQKMRHSAGQLIDELEYLEEPYCV